jgi:DNA gyrase subunit A
MTTTNGTAQAEIHTNGTNGAAPDNRGAVQVTDIVGEMQVAYLDYAMSVIVARALPDVRDGLKPVHRRILYAMYADLGLTFDKPHKKSARIVGEVLGKYHPHGDVAVYDAMARMAQSFSLRYPLVDGQGNFGSIDGDSPAAMRYTEARLAEISNLIIEDLDKDTVAWNPNFDNTLEEPAVLPAALPNLLINGANGIAVGMATNIPPHNLGEVVDALAFIIDRFAHIEEITAEELLHFVKGPDFPTGGILYRYRADGKNSEEIDAIAQGYSVGKSRLVMQAKAHFEELSRGRSRIIITELPYQTNKSTLIERIADLVRDGKLEGIADLRDESDRTGMRVVIELSRTAEPKDVLADLFKYTPLQQTFGMQLLALVDGQPRVLSLKRMLHLFIQHRQEIVRRRTEFDLARARERAHIVEGLLKALDILDEVISTIRNSQRVDTARANLMKNFDFTAVQAQAILDMQLRRLAALERAKLRDEFKELQKQIAELEELLAHPEKILALIKNELLAIKEKFGDARRTQIVDRTKGTLTTTDLLPDEMAWVSVGGKGDLRRQLAAQVSNTIIRQIGRGSEAGVVTVNTRQPLYLFTADGRSARLAVHEIPADGANKHLSDLSGLSRGDVITAALTLPPRNGDGETPGYLFLVTVQGSVKRIALADYLAAVIGAPTVIGIGEKDRLGWVFPTRGNQEVILVASNGQAIRFHEDEVRSMGLAAGGVGGVKLKSSDKVVYAAVVDPAGELITLTTLGYAKRSPLIDYPSQGRNGGGIVSHKLTTRTGAISTALLIPAALANETLLGVSRKGVPKLVALSDVPVMGRSVQGKQVMETTPSDAVVLLQRVLTAQMVTAVEPAIDASSDGEGGAPVAAVEPSANGPVGTNKPAVAQKTSQKQATAQSKASAAQAKPVKLAVVKPKAGNTRTATPAPPPKVDARKNGDQSAASVKKRDAVASASRPAPTKPAARLADAKQNGNPSNSIAKSKGANVPATKQTKPTPPSGRKQASPGAGKSTAAAKLPVRKAELAPAEPSVAKRSSAMPTANDQPTTSAKSAVSAAQPSAADKGGTLKLTTRPEEATQASLFPAEPTPVSRPADPRPKKVQTVVSVPASQVRKPKK